MKAMLQNAFPTFSGLLQFEFPPPAWSSFHNCGRPLHLSSAMPYKDPEAERAYHRAYRAAHREARRGYGRAYSAAHREARRAYQRAYYAAHREAIRACCAAYPEAKRACQRAYRRTDKGRQADREAKRKRRALKRQAADIAPDRVLTRQQWDKIVALSKGKCYWCGKKMTPITQDHVIPLSKGGLHVAENIVASCMPCNAKKHANIITLF